jgi:hypothetical protein
MLVKLTPDAIPSKTAVFVECEINVPEDIEHHYLQMVLQNIAQQTVR